MTGPTAPRWRALRSSAFALIAALLATMGHLVGGGSLPDPAVLAVATLVIGSAVSGLARTQRGFGGIFGVLAASQVAFHLLLGVSPHAMAGAGSAAPLELPRMALFHLVAAAVAAVVLTYGEAALFKLFTALHQVARAGPAPAAIELGPRWTVRPLARICPPPSTTFATPRRGPPHLVISC